MFKQLNNHFIKLLAFKANPGDILYSKKLFCILVSAVCLIAGPIQQTVIIALLKMPPVAPQQLLLVAIAYHVVHLGLLYSLLSINKLQYRWLQASCNYLGLDLIITISAVFLLSISTMISWALAILPVLLSCISIWILCVYIHITRNVFNTNIVVAILLQLLLNVGTSCITKIIFYTVKFI